MFPNKKPKSITIPEHIAIILDGNGRWAAKRGLPRTAGHQAGVENIRDVTLAAAEMGVKALSVFAFSTENWLRPASEVDFLMKLPKAFETRFKDAFEKHDIRVMFSGRKTKMSSENREILERITQRSVHRQGLVLNICFDYGSHEEILQAVQHIAQKVSSGELKPDDITFSHIEQELYTKDLPPLDLLIRPSGEQRLSNFMLYQAAYAELYFADVLWPDFSKKHLHQAIETYSQRDRRYGGLKGTS